jgi:organic hydroperoxide reductase OsmC/OhrA
MTRTVSLRFHGLPGSQAGLARSGRHMLIADRPEGLAGGQGLGFNGADFLSAALGGCFWNDLHYAAAALGHTLSAIEVAVEITLAGAPLRVTAATIRAHVDGESEEQARACFEAACRESIIANSMLAAFPIFFGLEGE